MGLDFILFYVVHADDVMLINVTCVPNKVTNYSVALAGSK